MRLILLTLLLITSPVYAGVSWKPLSSNILYVRMEEIEEQIREAKEASQKGLSRERLEEIREDAQNVIRASASAYIQDLIKLRDAVSEGRAFGKEILFHLSLNKKYGNQLTEFDVVSLKGMANSGRFTDAVKYMDGIIDRASSAVGAYVFMGSFIIE